MLMKSGDVKGTIRSDLRLLLVFKRCPPTPFDFNQLHIVVALSRLPPTFRSATVWSRETAMASVNLEVSWIPRTHAF